MFAASVVAVLTLARRHRQRRYVPRAPSPEASPPPADQPSPSRMLARLRRAHAAAQETDSAADNAGQNTAAPQGSRGSHYRGSHRRRDPSNASPRIAGSEIPMSVTEYGEIPIDLTAYPGIGLTGPGADDAARVLLLTLLIQRGCGHEAEIVIPREDVVRVLGCDAEWAEVPGLVVTADRDEALLRLQADVLHRARACQDHGDAQHPSGAFACYRQACPDQVLPTIVLAASVTVESSDMLRGVLTAGRGYAVTAVLLGEWPHGPTIAIDDDGYVTGAGTELSHLHGTRFFGLTPPDTREVLHLLTETTDLAEQPPPPSTDESDQPAAPALPGRRTPAHHESPSGEASSRPVRLEVFGPVRLRAAGQPLSRGVRRAAFEILAYLAAHPDGITHDRLLEDLWPDHTVNQATHKLNDATYSLRTKLRPLIGAVAETVITRDHTGYRLDPTIVEVDLWRFTDTYIRAARERDETSRLAAYQQAAQLYRGDFGEGLDGLWAETTRETLRYRALDVLTGIADLAVYPEQAMAALEQAAVIAPYDEAIHQRRLALLAENGRTDAAARAHELFTHRLVDELDTEPTPETEQLARSITHKTIATNMPDSPSLVSGE